QTRQRQIDPAAGSVFDRLGNAARKKIEVELLFAPRETPRHDLRFGIVNGAADQVVTAVFERNHVPVVRFSEHLQYLAGKNPVVSVKNPCARFDDKSSHVSANVQRSSQNVQWWDTRCRLRNLSADGAVRLPCNRSVIS